MRVSLAVQVFSHSVAAGISTMATGQILPANASYTALFLDEIDTLFNIFNSGSVKSKQPFRHAMSPQSGHVEKLEALYKAFESMTLIAGKRVPCLDGWMVSIRSLLSLWDDLQCNHGYSFLCTNRLNQDCLENLFSMVRGRGGFRERPDAQQFRAAFRQLAVQMLLVQSSKSNCIPDLDQILTDLKALMAAQSVAPPPAVADSVPAPVRSSAQLSCSLPCTNAIAYIAGYLLRRTSLHECHKCSFALSRPSPMPQGSIPLPCCQGLQRAGYSGLPTSLDIKVRLHHAIKVNNASLDSQGKGQKRNRKLMKLMHL
jgi:hypothetical protein